MIQYDYIKTVEIHTHKKNMRVELHQEHFDNVTTLKKVAMTLMSKSKQDFALIKSGGNHIIEKQISSCIQNLSDSREQIFKEWLKLKKTTTWVKQKHT